MSSKEKTSEAPTGAPTPGVQTATSATTATAVGEGLRNTTAGEPANNPGPDQAEKRVAGKSAKKENQSEHMGKGEGERLGFPEGMEPLAMFFGQLFQQSQQQQQIQQQQQMQMFQQLMDKQQRDSEQQMEQQRKSQREQMEFLREEYREQSRQQAERDRFAREESARERQEADERFRQGFSASQGTQNPQRELVASGDDSAAEAASLVTRRNAEAEEQQRLEQERKAQEEEQRKEKEGQLREHLMAVEKLRAELQGGGCSTSTAVALGMRTQQADAMAGMATINASILANQSIASSGLNPILQNGSYTQQAIATSSVPSGNSASPLTLSSPPAIQVGVDSRSAVQALVSVPVLSTTSPIASTQSLIPSNAAQALNALAAPFVPPIFTASQPYPFCYPMMPMEPPFGRFANTKGEKIEEWLDKMENWFARCRITESVAKAVYVRDYIDTKLWVDVRKFKELPYEQLKSKLIDLYGGLDNRSTYFSEYCNLLQKQEESAKEYLDRVRITVHRIQKFDSGTNMDNAVLDKFIQGASNDTFRKWALGRFAAGRLTVEEAKDRALAFELESTMHMRGKASITPTSFPVLAQAPTTSSGTSGGSSSCSTCAACNGSMSVAPVRSNRLNNTQQFSRGQVNNLRNFNQPRNFGQGNPPGNWRNQQTPFNSWRGYANNTWNSASNTCTYCHRFGNVRAQCRLLIRDNQLHREKQSNNAPTQVIGKPEATTTTLICADSIDVPTQQEQLKEFGIGQGTPTGSIMIGVQQMESQMMEEASLSEVRPQSLLHTHF